MTDGLSAEGRAVLALPDVRVLGVVGDFDGQHVAVGVTAGRVVIGCADDILGMSWEFTQEQVERLAQLLVRASWEAERHT